MSDKLTVEELVKTLRCCSGDINSCAGCQLECGQIYAQAADALETTTIERDGYREQLSDVLTENTRLAEKIPHWISVNDRLPEEDGNYLAVMDGDLCGQEEPFTSMCGIEKGKWDEPNMVLYWMPLPEPPKEEKAMKTVIAEKDGNAFVAHYDDFINLQESPAGYGDTPEEAKEMLYAESEGGKQ